MNSGIAVVRQSDNLVITVVREDLPVAWCAPEGCVAVPVSQLPDGWQYAPQVADIEQIRLERNEKLKGTDWTQLSDSPLSIPDKLLWANYRQELRDLPNNYIGSGIVVWPERPDGVSN